MNCLSNSADPIGYYVAACLFCLTVAALLIVIGLLVWTSGNTWDPTENLEEAGNDKYTGG